MAIVFDGRKLANEIEEKLKMEVTDFKMRTGVTPKLVDIIIGNDPSSVMYANMKKKAAERIGMEMEVVNFSENTEIQEIISKITELNNDKSIHGILVQLPLPEKSLVFSLQSSVLNSIDPKKDVDCLTSENFELLKTGTPRFLPATVKGIFEIIHNSKFIIHNSSVCVIGASGMVGRPLSDYLKSTGATVFECDENTKDISIYTKQADILISATGIPNLIKKEMVKPGAVVIDVGSPVGDVDFENVSKIASFITPVPGGVGPMTVISLLENTLYSCYTALA